MVGLEGEAKDGLEFKEEGLGGILPLYKIAGQQRRSGGQLRNLQKVVSHTPDASWTLPARADKSLTIRYTTSMGSVLWVQRGEAWQLASISASNGTEIRPGGSR